MSDFQGMGEKVYQCKVCGYVARSGAGLTGHIQLAHGERASGTKELVKIGEGLTQLGQEFSEFHADVVSHLSRLDEEDLKRLLADLTSEFAEFNRQLRIFREERQAAARPISPVSQPPQILLRLPLPPPPAPSPPPSVGEVIVGGLAIFGALSLLNALFGNKGNS